MITDFHVVSIPTKTNFRGINVREAVLFKGSHGWSEFSPFLEYGPDEAATWLNAALEAAEKPWPKLVREKIPVNATLPNVETSRVPDLLREFEGCRTIKIKVDNFESDVKLVETALDVVPAAKIRLDVNGKWTLDQAVKYLTQYVQHFGSVFEYVEQPVGSTAELAKLRQRVDVKIAVDESIRKNVKGDMEMLRHVADVAILKWQPSGGISAAHELIERIGLPVVISSALDTGVGISHALALAGSLEELQYACGLGTVALLESDICEPPVVPHKGYMDVSRPMVNHALLERYRASEERYEWWHNRITEIERVRG